MTFNNGLGRDAEGCVAQDLRFEDPRRADKWYACSLEVETTLEVRPSERLIPAILSELPEKFEGCRTDPHVTVIGGVHRSSDCEY
jgi:hypothetical protein